MDDSFSDFNVQKVEAITLPQVKHFYRQNNMRAQAAKLDEVYVLKNKGRLLAALRLCPLDNVWLLRSMCVEARSRRQGIGQFFLQQIQPALHDKQCYSFPYMHLTAFYQQAGFQLLTEDTVPEIIGDKFRLYRRQGKKIILMKHQLMGK